MHIHSNNKVVLSIDLHTLSSVFVGYSQLMNNLFNFHYKVPAYNLDQKVSSNDVLVAGTGPKS